MKQDRSLFAFLSLQQNSAFLQPECFGDLVGSASGKMCWQSAWCSTTTIWGDSGKQIHYYELFTDD